MPQASLDALLLAYKAQVDWLLTQAEQLEMGDRRLLARMSGDEIDLSANVAEEYRHKAGNMQAVLAAYERLHARGN